MDGLSTDVAVIPLVITCLNTVCQLISDYRSFQDDIQDFTRLSQDCWIRLERVHDVLNELSLIHLSELHIATISGLLQRLRTLRDEMERKLLKAQEIGASRWDLTRYSAKLMQMVQDLKLWLDEMERILLILNGNGIPMLPRNLATCVGGQLPSRMLLQNQASSPTPRFRRQPEEIPPEAFKLMYEYGHFAVGEVENRVGKFITEYKSFPLQTSTSDKKAADDHVSQLATLLHNAADCDKNLSVLKCDYIFQDPAMRVYGLVSAMPSDSPKSLRDLLAFPALEPALQVKFRLAGQIFQSVERLHLYRWLHKSLRSNNVYFFGFIDMQTMLEPKLLGFEYSRPVQQASHRMKSSNHLENLARHPERWNLPTCAFAVRHDIYAAGILLMEIYLWRSIDAWEDGELQKPIYRNPAAAADWISGYARKTLPCRVGDKAASAVIGCLEGHWNQNPVSEASADITKMLIALSDAIQ